MNAKDQKIIDEAQENWRLCNDMMAQAISDAKDDIKFEIGDHWPEDIKKERADDGRPCIVENRIPSFINQVTNDIRQNRPQIKVRPVDDTTDPKTAKVINGMIRHICQHSDADAAFDCAVEYAVSCGLGYFRVTTDYCNDDSFDQEILVKRISNPFQVKYPLHLCKEADYSDAPYAFIVDEMPKEEFEKQYPEAEMGNWDSYPGDWIDIDSVKVCEYWRRIETEKTIYLLSDGSVVEKLPEGWEAVKERKSKDVKIEWFLLTAAQILDRGEWAGKCIPIIPITGKEVVDVDSGRRHYVSLTRNAKDPQRMLNYWKSAETEAIALAPKSPYLIAEGQIEGFESIWQEANRRNVTVLPYKPTSASGEPVPMPQRIPAPSIPTAFVQAIGEAIESMKAVTGIHDASLGGEGNEKSGKAIIARQRQGQTSNFHFVDNESRAIKLCGRIIVDLIPKIYDTARAVRILGDDMQDEVVTVNDYYNHNGEDVLYDVTAGQYDVVVDVGPSYATKRQESVENLLELIGRAGPNAAPLLLDLAVKNLDFSEADVAARRLKRAFVPPQLDAEEGEDGQQKQQGEFSPEEMQQIVADMQNTHGQLGEAEQAIEILKQQNAQLQQAGDQRQHENQNKELDRQARIAETVIKSDAEIEKERIKTRSAPAETER